ERVKLDLTMVSHIDDDHINGILDLADEIESHDAPAEITILWHNSLEGLLHQKVTAEVTAAVTASIPAALPRLDDEWAQKVLASVPQGQRLHGFAKRTGIIDFMNKPYQPLVLAKPEQAPAVFADLSLTVISPTAKEVEKLRQKWIELRD